jgi:hypothetical protein
MPPFSPINLWMLHSFLAGDGREKGGPGGQRTLACAQGFDAVFDDDDPLGADPRIS